MRANMRTHRLSAFKRMRTGVRKHFRQGTETRLSDDPDSSSKNPAEVSSSFLGRYLKTSLKSSEVENGETKAGMARGAPLSVENKITSRNTTSGSGEKIEIPSPVSRESFSQTAVAQLALAGRWSCRKCTYRNEPVWLVCGYTNQNCRSFPC